MFDFVVILNFIIGNNNHILSNSSIPLEGQIFIWCFEIWLTTVLGPAPTVRVQKLIHHNCLFWVQASVFCKALISAPSIICKKTQSHLHGWLADILRDHDGGPSFVRFKRVGLDGRVEDQSRWWSRSGFSARSLSLEAKWWRPDQTRAYQIKITTSWSAMSKSMYQTETIPIAIAIATRCCWCNIVRTFF